MVKKKQNNERGTLTFLRVWKINPDSIHIAVSILFLPTFNYRFRLKNYSVMTLLYLFPHHQSSVGQSKLSAVTLRAIQRRQEDQYP